MKTFELKKESWHYWVANFGETRVYEETDICSYIRYMIRGGLLLALCVIVGGGAGAATLFAIGNLFSWLFLGYDLHETTKIVGIAFIILVMIPATVILGVTAKEKMEEGEPGFIRLAYRSWKDKFCAKVELK